MEHSCVSVKTIGTQDCPREQAWDTLAFYEHITMKPSLFLRMALPIPVRSEGKYGKIGDVSQCEYSDGGCLVKKITRLVETESIEFDVTGQSIRFHSVIRLLNAGVALRDKANGETEVILLTRYSCLLGPQTVIQFFVRFVISAVHKIVLQDMRRHLSSGSISPRPIASMTNNTSCD